MIQQDLSALGIKVNIVPLDFPSLIQRIRELPSWEAALREHLIAPLGLTHVAALPEEALLFRTAVGHIDGGPDGAQQVAPTSVALTSMQRVHGCPVLNLTLGPVHLDVLGLVVDLQQLNLKVQAVPGRRFVLVAT